MRLLPKSLRMALTLLFAAIALRFPYFAFLDHFSSRQGRTPFSDYYKTWCVWDCQHYARLSEGYTLIPEDIAWFPGFPWAVHAVNAFHSFTPFAATLIAATLFTTISILLLILLGARLAYKDEWIEKFPWDARPWTLGAIAAFFPTSHFWSSGYAECLFMALFAGGFLFLLLRKWKTAFACIGLIGIVRNQGLWIAGICSLALCWDLLAAALAEKRDREGKSLFLKRVFPFPFHTAVICLILAATPTSCFLLWQWIGKGDPFWFVHVLSSATWNRGFKFWDVVRYHRPKFDLNYTLLILSWIASIRFLRRPEIEWKLLGVLTWVLAILPLGVGGFAGGYGRYMGTSLGLLILLLEWLGPRYWIALPYLAWSIFRLSIEIEGWTIGLWRG